MPSALILEGKSLASEIRKEMKEKVVQGRHRKPQLALILVGSHAPSKIYVQAKQKACQETGIESKLVFLQNDATQNELIHKIQALNDDPFVDGILVQFPLPSHLEGSQVVEAISPAKDVDGLHPLNIGKLLRGEKEGFIPCTPLGIHVLLQKYQIPIEGRHVVIVGRSILVGKPLAALLMQKKPHCSATVTVAHSQSQNLISLVRSADIVVAAIGSPRFIKPEMLSPHSTVIDVGINRLLDGTLVGDVDFPTVCQKVSAITPVPGGIGPMTIAMLLKNTLLSYETRDSDDKK